MRSSYFQIIDSNMQSKYRRDCLYFIFPLSTSVFLCENFQTFGFIACACETYKGKKENSLPDHHDFTKHITIFFRAQRCVHHHLGQSSQNMSCHPCHSTLTRSQAHSLHLFLIHHFDFSLIYNPISIDQFQHSKTYFTNIWSSQRPLGSLYLVRITQIWKFFNLKLNQPRSSTMKTFFCAFFFLSLSSNTGFIIYSISILTLCSSSRTCFFSVLICMLCHTF